MLVSYSEELLAPWPNPQPAGSSIACCPWLLIQQRKFSQFCSMASTQNITYHLIKFYSSKPHMTLL